MPTLHVELFEGRTLQQKAALAKELTDACVRVLGGSAAGGALPGHASCLRVPAYRESADGDAVARVPGARTPCLMVHAVKIPGFTLARPNFHGVVFAPFSGPFPVEASR